MRYVRIKRPVVMHAALSMLDDIFSQSSIDYLGRNAVTAIKMKMPPDIANKFVPLKGKYKTYVISEKGCFVYHIEYEGIDVVVWEDWGDIMGEEAEERTFLPDEMFEI